MRIEFCLNDLTFENHVKNEKNMIPNKIKF